MMSTASSAGCRRLMERDRLYTDEDLTIAQLGERLVVSRNQLSELINGRIA